MLERVKGHIDVFILDTWNKLFQWNGSGANPDEKLKAGQCLDSVVLACFVEPTTILMRDPPRVLAIDRCNPLDSVADVLKVGLFVGSSLAFFLVLNDFSERIERPWDRAVVVFRYELAPVRRSKR